MVPCGHFSQACSFGWSGDGGDDDDEDDGDDGGAGDDDDDDDAVLCLFSRIVGILAQGCGAGGRSSSPVLV